jgi:hypothetical protein
MDADRNFRFSSLNIFQNIPTAPVYGVSISQLICHTRGGSWYSYFLHHSILNNKLLLQEFFFKNLLILPFKSCSVDINTFFEIYPVNCVQMTITFSLYSQYFSGVIDVLQEEGNIFIDLFHFDCMQANPCKFQAVAIVNK